MATHDHQYEYTLSVEPNWLKEQSETLPKSIDYKYNERDIILSVQKYVADTYGAHHVPEDGDLQAIDAWFALGNANTSFRDTIIKYAWRLGKKEGHRKDLLKIIHYAIFYLHYCDKKGLK